MRNQEQNPENTVARWPLGEMEPELAALRTQASLIGHLVSSSHEVSDEEWHHVQTQIIDRVNRLGDLWRQAWDAHAAESARHRAELDRERARNVPLSEKHAAEMMSLRNLLRATAEEVLNSCGRVLAES